MIRALALAAVLALASCGGTDPPPRAATPTPAPTAKPKPRPSTLPRPPCRAERSGDERSARGRIPGCASVSGVIVYVERVDPDGDGDLHVVVTDRHAVTLAGLTAIDVSRDLRPRRDPRIGDQAAAMGPVQRGSYGQDQIHALVFRTRRQ